MCKMQKDNDDLMDHVYKVRAFVDQLACLEVHVRDKDLA